MEKKKMNEQKLIDLLTRTIESSDELLILIQAKLTAVLGDIIAGDNIAGDKIVNLINLIAEEFSTDEENRKTYVDLCSKIPHLAKYFQW